MRSRVTCIIGGFVALVNSTMVTAQAPGNVSAGLSLSSGVDRVRADAELSSTSWNGLRIAFSPTYRSNRSAPAAFGTERSVRMTVYARHGAGGAWVGARDFSGISAGLWRGWRNAVFSLATQDHAMRVVGRGISYRQITITDSAYSDSAGWHPIQRNEIVSDSNVTTQARRWSEIEARLDWTPRGVGGLRLGAALSTSRPGWGPRTDSSRVHRQVWGRVTATMPVGSQLALIASGGSESSLQDAARPSRFLTFGLRWNPFAADRNAGKRGDPAAAPEFSLSPSTPGMYTITVRSAAAQSVEITGDFAGWKPVALHQSEPGMWQATLPLRPGTYRINERVDGGAWTVPRGLAAVDDEFNGRVGIIVVR